MLVGGDPTPDQARLYASNANGFSSEEKNDNRFLATFVLGVYRTRNWQAKSFRKVTFAIPRPLDTWAVSKINWIIQTIRDQRAQLQISKEAKQQANKMIVEAITNLEMGSRVFTLAEEPSHWVAFGFKQETEMPEWLRRGLL